MRELYEYIGVPFREKGRDMSGWDCYGMFRFVAREQDGLILPSFVDDYENVDDYNSIGGLLKSNLNSWVKIDQAKSGDLVWLKLPVGVLHVGYVLGDKNFLHVERGVETCMENYGSLKWRDRVKGVYRYGR